MVRKTNSDCDNLLFLNDVVEEIGPVAPRPLAVPKSYLPEVYSW